VLEAKRVVSIVFSMALERIAHSAVEDRCTAGFRSGLWLQRTSPVHL